MLPMEALRARGHDTGTGTVMPHPRDAAGYDFVVAQRVCEPSPSGRWQVLGKTRPCTLVFDIDDNLWHLDDSNPARGYFNADRQRLLRQNIEIADLVTVSTEPLAEVVREFHDNVVVLPNAVPGWLLEHPAPGDGEPVTIGWAGSATHHRDFGEVARPLKRVLQRYPQHCECHVISPYAYTARVESIRGRARHSYWVNGVANFLQAIDFHIGLAPLWPSPFNDAKSPLKMLEYAALGIPAIVSNTGPYARAVADGAPVRTAVTAKEWEQHLIELVHDPIARAAEGEKAREWVAAHTIEQNAHRWEDAYRAILPL